MKVLCVTLMEKSRGYIRSSFPWVLRVRRFVVIEGPSKITPLTINVKEETIFPNEDSNIYKFIISN